MDNDDDAKKYVDVRTVFRHPDHVFLRSRVLMLRKFVRVRWLFMLLLVSIGMAEATAQTRRRASNTTVTTVDSLTRMVIVVNERRQIRDTVFKVKDTGTYVPLLPPDARQVLPFRDAEGAVVYHNLPYVNPVLSVQVKLVQTVIRDLRELKIFVTFNNRAPHAQKFLFDRPSAPGFALWGASCRIISDQHGNVLSHGGKPRYEVRAADSATMRRHQYVLKPSEWMMKQFSVADIVVLNENKCKQGKLPPGNYTLQLIFQQNRSNIVKFTVRS